MRCLKIRGAGTALATVNPVGIFKYILLVIVIWNVRAFADEYQPQVNASTVSNLQQVLRQSGREFSTDEIKNAEDLFRARSTAHRVRLSQLFLELSKDPNFTKRFPEFKPLLKSPQKTVQSLLEHDASKGLEKTKYAIRVLALLQGYDYRHPNKGLTPEADLVVRQALKGAIDDINYSDKKIMTDKLNRASRDPHWRSLHESLTETLDFYDTYKSRQDELAKEGRKLSPPSEWIEKLQSEGHYTDVSPNKIDLEKRFAKYLETKDPLQGTDHFAKSEEYLDSKRDEKFYKKGDTLLRSAGVHELRNISKNFVSGNVAGFAVSGAGLALDYLVDPESASRESLITSTLMVNETSSCDTVGCQSFVRKCAQKLKLSADTSQSKIFSNPKFGICIEDFFQQPLEIQSQLRIDGNLNNILLMYSPAVRNLTCSKRQNDLQVILETSSQQDRFTEQKLQIQNDHVLQMSWAGDHGRDRLLFSVDQPNLLQHCDQNSTCQNWNQKTAVETKQYFWNQRKFPLTSFRWARQSDQLLRFQKTKIIECCSSKSCQSYFSEVERNRKSISEVAGLR